MSLIAQESLALLPHTVALGMDLVVLASFIGMTSFALKFEISRLSAICIALMEIAFLFSATFTAFGRKIVLLPKKCQLRPLLPYNSPLNQHHPAFNQMHQL